MSAEKGNTYASKPAGKHTSKVGRLVFDLGEERKRRFAAEAGAAGRSLKGHLVAILEDRWNVPVSLFSLEDGGFQWLGQKTKHMSLEESLDKYGICWREWEDVEIVYARSWPPDSGLSREWHRVTIARDVDLRCELPWAQIDQEWLDEQPLGHAIAMLFDEFGPTALFGLPQAGHGFIITR